MRWCNFKNSSLLQAVTLNGLVCDVCTFSADQQQVRRSAGSGIARDFVTVSHPAHAPFPHTDSN